MHCQKLVSPKLPRFAIARRSLCSTGAIARAPITYPLRSTRPQSRAFPAPIHLPHPAIAFGIPQARSYSSSDVSEDPDRKGLYYHPIGNKTYALSFLSEKPSRPDSPTVIGHVPEDAGLDGFKENLPFVDLLHDTVKAALVEGVDKELTNDATQRQEGWLHVHDLRNFPEQGRVGDPDDIVGSVLVQEGKIKGDTYQRMPSYRTVTRDGPLRLTSSLHERLLKALKEAHQKDSK